MEYYIFLAVIFVIGLSIWMIARFRKFKDEQKLKELVAWIVRNDDSVRSYIPLWAYIKNAQLHCNVPPQYRIVWDDERESVDTILSVFQEHLTQSFFRGEISHKRVSALTLRMPTAEYTDFFVFQLFCFLSNYRCDSHVLGRDVYARQISYKSHGMWGGLLYDAVYEFSDFGRTVQKLYYITFLACKESVIYRDEIAEWLTPEYFTDDLDSNTIHISRM